MRFNGEILKREDILPRFNEEILKGEDIFERIKEILMNSNQNSELSFNARSCHKNLTMENQVRPGK